MQDKIQLIESLIENIKDLEIINNFKYYKEFLRIWEKKLIQSAKSSTIYLSNNNEAQCYHYEGKFYNTHLAFDFNVSYLIRILEISLELKDNTIPKIELVNNNGVLMHNGFHCIYTKYKADEISNTYSNLEKILVSPIPLLTNELVVLDGNHRICKQIFDNISVISAYYILDGIAVNSLSTPFQICLYSFLFDIARIQKNIGRVSDGYLRNQLNIFNPKSSFFIAYNRKNINPLP